jgi:hypothetical protein
MKRHVIAITVLLLGLQVQTSAQNRSPEEALKGLREIGVTVKYGNVDGLAEEMRATTLQALHDRARNMLMQADVPLLESTDNVEITGKPRLVFTVTVNKETKHAAAIKVDAAVTERVRLRRDQSKEVELVTWMQSGIGSPTVTTKLLFDVFDGQVNGFVKRYKENNPKTTEGENRTTDTTTQVKEDANSLQGLPGIRSFASIRQNAPIDEEQRVAMEKVVQSEIEKKLKRAGISLLKYSNESEPAGDPILYVWVKLSGPNYQAPAIEIETKFWQHARPLRDVRKDLHVVTWESQTNDNVAITNDAVLEAVNRQLDEFIKAYNAANPKLSANPK